MFESLDFVYVPTEDVDVAARRYVEALGAELVWKVRGMGTVVACLRVSAAGPAILLTSHLEGETPILIYRVADYGAAVERLRAPGHRDPRARDPARAVRELPRSRRAALRRSTSSSGPMRDEHFAGRIDE